MENNLEYSEPAMQDDLVADYCAEADAFLSTAADYATALQMKDWLCKRFEEKCASTLIVHAAQEYIEHRVRERWGNGPENTAQDRS